MTGVGVAGEKATTADDATMRERKGIAHAVVFYYVGLFFFFFLL